jgi:CHAT domain-containing protein
LGTRQPITLLPSIGSLSSLRKIASRSAGEQAFIGFGNPLLMGPKRDDRSAWNIRTCADARDLPSAQVRSARSPMTQNSVGLQADRRALLAQEPLPETAVELCSVGRTLGAPESAIHLGDRAREGIVKALSMSGALAQAKIVHFATHGVLSSESERLGGGGEPGLILTPPEETNDADDGLLTASEVAQLKLDADWVVLSACNTAAGGGGVEQFSKLSGLARAFFYAGARALLVSHWAIDSDAAVKLTTKTFAALRDKPDIGRAEAFRQSLMAMISDTTRPKGWTPAAHPSVWGPFMLVGEGRN